jgi:putative ATP-dependent endonuclease of the OLD family
VKAIRLQVRNFRSISELDVDLGDHGLLIGANNAGKSNVLSAIRVFYEEIKYSEVRDLPKFRNDGEVWVQITYALSPDEHASLKEEYQQTDQRITIRKVIVSKECGRDGKPRQGLYYLSNDALSDSLFYGAKNIQNAKLGRVIYIPAVGKLDDHTKLSGPSAMRDLISGILSHAIASSDVYAKFREAFAEFRDGVKSEVGTGDSSLGSLEDSLTSSLAEWGMTMRLDVGDLDMDDALKRLIQPKILDPQQPGTDMPEQFGQGLQRHLIYSVLLLAGQALKPVANRPTPRKDFNGELSWLLFEEPEVFLHPAQSERLDRSLRLYARQPNQQVLITTHSTHFCSRNLGDLTGLIRLARVNGVSTTAQVKRPELDALLSSNERDAPEPSSFGDENPLALEEMRYALWLDQSRTSALFATRVLVVEGATERCVLEHLVEQERFKVGLADLVVLDGFGHHNMLRFVSLLSALKIKHAVLYDLDGGKNLAERFEGSLFKVKTDFTCATHALDQDFEVFLGIGKKGTSATKPQWALWNVSERKVGEDRLVALCKIVQKLIDSMA